MSLINPQDADFIRRRFAADLEADVRLLLFLPSLGGIALPGEDWEFAEQTRRILREVADLSDKVQVEEHSAATEAEQVQRYGITLTPTIVFLRDGADGDGAEGQDFGLRYVGLPAGYEFVTLLDLIIAVSRGRADLAEQSRETLTRLADDVHLQVFVTPT